MANILLELFEKSKEIPVTIEHIYKGNFNKIDAKWMVQTDLNSKNYNHEQMKEFLFDRLSQQTCDSMFIKLHLPSNPDITLCTHIDTLLSAYKAQHVFIEQIEKICMYHPSADLIYMTDEITHLDKIHQIIVLMYDFKSKEEYENVKKLFICRMQKMIEDTKTIIQVSDYIIVLISKIIIHLIIKFNVDKNHNNDNTDWDYNEFLNSTYYTFADIYKSQWILNTPEYSNIDVDEHVDYCSILSFIAKDLHSTILKILELFNNYNISLVFNDEITLEENKQKIFNYMAYLEQTMVLLVRKAYHYSKLVVKNKVDKEIKKIFKTDENSEYKFDMEKLKNTQIEDLDSHSFKNMETAIFEDEIIIMNLFTLCLKFVNQKNKILIQNNYPDINITFVKNDNNKHKMIINKYAHIRSYSSSIDHNFNSQKFMNGLMNLIDAFIIKNDLTNSNDVGNTIKILIDEIIYYLISSPKINNISNDTKTSINNVNNNDNNENKVIIYQHISDERFKLKNIDKSLDEAIIKAKKELLKQNKTKKQNQTSNKN